MMESPPTVCYSMGTINSLVEKITPLLENHPMMEDLLQDVKSLREDLMNKFAAGGRASGGDRVKVWMKQVREMVYDMEDWIDLKLQEEGANLSQSDKPRMDGFRSLIQDARGRCERYELLERAAAATANSDAGAGRPGEVAGGRLLWEEKTVLLGIDAPKSELLNHLSSEQKELKVVSILGAGGHGKTALAREIYRDICTTKQFECQAFVSVGRTTSTRTALIELLRQVKSDTNAPQSRSYNDEKQVSEIITELFRFLKTKRYFICIDDIRSTQDSESITCALPDNNLGSRILTTSRMKDIAKLCSRRPSDVVYEMMSLGEDNTRSLFLNNVYVQEEEWPDHFKESSKKLFKVCGDVPFAIIITAGLLGRTSAELSARSDRLTKTILSELSARSERLTKTILSELDQFDSAPQVMGKILDISYGDLPLPLKSCFLYMAAFIGNHGIIKRGRLIQRWVAEGLIPERHGKSSLETGASYFDELISRRLIQPAFDDNDDQPIGCTVHGVVADFVASLSTEENFITMGAELKSGGLFPCDRVRRVSLDYSGEDEADTSFSTTYCLLEQKSWVCSDEKPSSDIDEAISLHLSRVRSLAFLGDATRIPDVSALKHMRVLDLEDTKGLENKHLGSIGQLSLLRYLGLCGTNVTVLPPEVMALKQLTTLNLRQTRVKRLPKFGDTKLVSLLAHQLTILPRGMGVMAELEELSEVLVGQDGSHAGDVARLIAELGQLRMLGVRFGRLFNNQETDRRGVKHLLEEMAKSNLQSLLLDNYLHHLLDLLIASWAKKRPQYLRKFELRIPGCLPLVPPDIGSLIALTHLHIHVEAVEPQAVHALGCLPNLVVLRLELSTDPTLTVCGTDGFQCLKVFWYGGGGNGIGLRFEVGAMPQLRRLRLDLDAREAMLNYGHLQFGIQHLPCLVHVHAIIQCKDASAGTEVDGMEAFIRDQVSLNPNDPVLEINTRVQRSVAKAAEGAVIAIHNREGWMNQIDPDKLMVVDFSTSWCPASRRMAPVFADLAKMYPNVVFLTVDVDDNDEMSTVAKQFGVNGVPTFLFMKGGYVQDRVVGAEKEELEEKLQEHAALML